MLKRRAVWVLVIAVAVCLVGAAQRVTVQPLRPILLIPPTHYLRGNVEKAEGIAVTEKGQEEGSFFGTIGFEIWAQEKGDPRLQLSNLSLVSPGVRTPEGPSGVLGITLDGPFGAVEYNPRTGEFQSDIEAELHYALIDRLRGFRQQECRGECDLFESYTERVVGKFTGRFAEPLEPRKEGQTRAEGDVILQLSDPILGFIREIRVRLVIILHWFVFEPAEALRIQPVFVGSGPSDPNASGSAFNTLMNHAHDMWNRCGDVRCIKFIVNEPIYVNNNAYKVLDNSSEAAAFRGEVDVANAIEVFVAREMSTSLACSWGGGACFSSGTASAKIVSCDQQMAVPCPCPPACTSYCPCGSCLCGAINPYHLAHELGHALDLAHPPGPSGGLAATTVNSIMEPSGFCCDNPNAQSAKNCRNASNPLLFSLFSICSGTPDISD